jgi:hypothetical protein
MADDETDGASTDDGPGSGAAEQAPDATAATAGPVAAVDQRRTETTSSPPPAVASAGASSRSRCSSWCPRWCMLGVWLVYPTLFTVWRSFFDAGGDFVGVDNYRDDVRPGQRRRRRSATT